MQTALVGDGAGLIERNVRMTLQVVKRQLVHIQSPRRGVLNNQELFGIERKILDFIELIDTYIATKALTVFHYLSGEIRADAWHHLQLRRIGGIQHDVLSSADLRLIMGLDGVVLHIWKSMAALESCVAIDYLCSHINRLHTCVFFSVGITARTIAMMLLR